jgi:hypothetical protein
LFTILASLNFDASFWTLEILFIIFLMYKLFKIQIGNHQKVTIFLLAVVLFIMQIISIFIPRTKHNDCNGQECKRKYISDNNLLTIIIEKFGNYYYIPIIIIFYNIGYILKDYCWVKSKFLMDIKNVKMHHILYSIGIIGSLMAIIGFILLTIFPCRSFKNVERIDDFFYSFQYFDDNNNLQKISLHSQICSLDNYNETSKELKLYFDNVFLLFNSISSNNNYQNCLEIFALLIYLLMNIIISLSQMIMLKKLDAIILLVNNNFNYFIGRIIFFILTKKREDYLRTDLFILLELEELISMIAYMIYMEIIELKFCRLDYDLKRNIHTRGISDLESIHQLNDEEEEEEEQNNKDEKEELVEMV